MWPYNTFDCLNLDIGLGLVVYDSQYLVFHTFIYMFEYLIFSRTTMGGIQAKAGSVAEVHAVRGGQLILRIAPSQTTAHIMEAKREARRRSSRRGKFGSGFASLGTSFEGEGNEISQCKDVTMGSLSKINKYNGTIYFHWKPL